MYSIASDDSEKKDKKKLKRYWSFVVPPGYADDMIGDENGDDDEGDGDGGGGGDSGGSE